MTSPLILCATSRLAQTLRSRPPDNAAEVWDTPGAVTLESWLDLLGEQAMLSGILPARVVLDGFSEKILWQRVIADSIAPDEAPLFDIAAMAARAAEAHALSTVWALGTSAEGLSREAALFVQWRAEFRRRLEVNGWTVAADRREAVVRALERHRLHVRLPVVFAGFDDLTPLQRRLARAVAAQMPPAAAAQDPDCRPAVTAYEDVRAECRAVARWAGSQLASSPHCRIGIVVPDLDSVRGHLEYELEQILHPELATPAFAEHPRLYNFSLGHALAEVPLVASALQLLRLAAGAACTGQAALAALLLSPYWSDSVNESDARALLDARMRRRFRSGFDLADAVAFARSGEIRDRVRCPAAVGHLSELVRQAAECNGGARLPSAWGDAVRTLLFRAGWAGSGARGCRAMSSHEYQAREAWSELLDRFSRADHVLGALTFPQALAHLQSLCRERLFQPQTRGTPPVHVLGMLESTGLEFDALWVMGMHDGAWPPAPSPDPLIPAALQRTHGIPNSCAAVQLAHARRILDRLQRQAPLVRFSCPLMDGQQELRHSPLFVRMDAGAAGGLAAPAPAPGEEKTLECIDDGAGPALGENERVRGGVALLRAQAICPAWAFYRYRLGAAALECPQEGLGAQDRGTLVHDALEWFWTRVTGRQALEELAGRPGALEDRIAAAVDASLEGWASRVGPLPPGVRGLEVDRMTRLLHRWLNLERQRPDFVVLECEREIRHEVGPVPLVMRIDRVDRQDGMLVVIDYKTGTAGGTGSWAAQRITEPQLPLYALALSDGQDEAVGALVFGRVLPVRPCFSGLSADDRFIPGVSGMHGARGRPFAAFPDWDALQEHWRTRIAAVADEFARGVASVTIDAGARLDYCEVLPLLRLPEREAVRAGLLTLRLRLESR